MATTRSRVLFAVALLGVIGMLGEPIAAAHATASPEQSSAEQAACHVARTYVREVDHHELHALLAHSSRAVARKAIKQEKQSGRWYLQEKANVSAGCTAYSYGGAHGYQRYGPAGKYVSYNLTVIKRHGHWRVTHTEIAG